MRSLNYNAEASKNRLIEKYSKEYHGKIKDNGGVNVFHNPLAAMCGQLNNVITACKNNSYHDDAFIANFVVLLLQINDKEYLFKEKVRLRGNALVNQFKIISSFTKDVVLQNLELLSKLSLGNTKTCKQFWQTNVNAFPGKDEAARLLAFRQFISGATKFHLNEIMAGLIKSNPDIIKLVVANIPADDKGGLLDKLKKLDLGAELIAQISSSKNIEAAKANATKDKPKLSVSIGGIVSSSGCEVVKLSTISPRSLALLHDDSPSSTKGFASDSSDDEGAVMRLSRAQGGNGRLSRLKKFQAGDQAGERPINDLLSRRASLHANKSGSSPRKGG